MWRGGSPPDDGGDFQQGGAGTVTDEVHLIPLGNQVRIMHAVTRETLEQDLQILELECRVKVSLHSQRSAVQDTIILRGASPEMGGASELMGELLDFYELDVFDAGEGPEALAAQEFQVHPPAVLRTLPQQVRLSLKRDLKQLELETGVGVALYCPPSTRCDSVLLHGKAESLPGAWALLLELLEFHVSEPEHARGKRGFVDIDFGDSSASEFNLPPPPGQKRRLTVDSDAAFRIVRFYVEASAYLSGSTRRMYGADDKIPPTNRFGRSCVRGELGKGAQFQPGIGPARRVFIAKDADSRPQKRAKVAPNTTRFGGEADVFSRRRLRMPKLAIDAIGLAQQSSSPGPRKREATAATSFLSSCEEKQHASPPQRLRDAVSNNAPQVGSPTKRPRHGPQRRGALREQPSRNKVATRKTRASTHFGPALRAMASIAAAASSSE